MQTFLKRASRRAVPRIGRRQPVAGHGGFVGHAFIVNVALPSTRRTWARAAADGGGHRRPQIAYAAMVITGGRLGDTLSRRRLFV